MPWWGWLLLSAGAGFVAYQVWRTIEAPAPFRARKYRLVGADVLNRVYTLPAAPRARATRGPGVA